MTTDRIYARVLLYVELRTKKYIREYFDNLAPEDKRELQLLPYDPVIPATEKERTAAIIAFANHLVNELTAQPAAKCEAVQLMKALGLVINRNLPPWKLHATIVHALKSVEPKLLLEAGVYGKPHTISDVDKARERHVNLTYKAMIKHFTTNN